MTTPRKENAPAGTEAPNEASKPNSIIAQKIGNLDEPRRLSALGFKMCKLLPNSKQPDGSEWNKRPVKNIDPAATGYGLILAQNNLVSIDPDNYEKSKAVMAAWGFDLETILDAGVRTRSTRPGSGGRSAFKFADGLTWVKFSFKGFGTVLELRAASANLQDCIPGVEYVTKNGDVCTQYYDGPRRFDDAGHLPRDFHAFWRRCSADLDFLREQQRIAGDVLGVKPDLAISGGGNLAFASQCRVPFNGCNGADDILARHGYEAHGAGRWSAPTATGGPGIRPIPGKDGLWQSDHASDPLHGTFDAWTAHVVLDHGGDLSAAEYAYFDDAFKDTETPVDRRRLSLDRGRINPFPGPVPPRDFVVDGFLLAGKSAVLASPGGVGKTTFVMQLAADGALGVSTMGFVIPKPFASILILGEEDEEERDRRFTAVIRDRANVFDRDDAAETIRQRVAAFPMAGESISITKKQGRDATRPDMPFINEILATAEQHSAAGVPVRLIVIDHATLAFGGDHNAAEDIAVATQALAYIAKKTHAAVLLLGHTNKSALKAVKDKEELDAGMMLGSVAYINNTRGAFVMMGAAKDANASKYSTTEEGRKGLVKVAAVKANYTPPGAEWWLRQKAVPGVGAAVFTPAVEVLPRVEREIKAADDSIKERVLAKVRGNPGKFTKTKLKTYISPEHKAEQAINELISEGVLIQRKQTEEERQQYGARRAENALFIFGVCDL